jgi:hypothetical protein
MTENLIASSGDALSKLIKIQAARYDIRLQWVGDGLTDLAALCNAHAAKARIARHLWGALRELLSMTEMNDMPEAIQAQITSTILKAQALTDLDTQEHAERLRTNKQKGAN